MVGSTLLFLLSLLVQAENAPESPAAKTSGEEDAETEPDIPVRDVEDRTLRWEGSLKKAKAEARLRNVPILVVLAEETNTGFGYMLGRVFLTPGFAADAGDKVVPLICMRGQTHDGEEVEIDGKTIRICDLFDIPCDDHEAGFEEVWNEKVFRTYWGPITMILDPDGNELLRLEGKDHDMDRILDEISFAAKKVGRGVDLKTYRKLIGTIESSRKHRSAGNIQKSLGELARLSERKGTPPGFVQFASREREAIEVEGQQECAAALELSADNRTRAISELRKIANRYRGSPVREKALELVEQVVQKGTAPAPDPWTAPFTPPEILDTPRMHLEPLKPSHVELDYAALMGSRQHLKETLHWGDWPRENFTLDENREDLERHWGEFERREAYAYTVLSPDRSRCVGCIYLNPVSIEDVDPVPRQASFTFWVIESELENDLDEHLAASVVEWIEAEWPLDTLVFVTHRDNVRGEALVQKMGLGERGSPSRGRSAHVWERAVR